MRTRIHVLSDLHLEFSDFRLPDVDADIRVLAGDIHTRERGAKYALAQTSAIPICYVAGNHEFYGTAIPKLYDKIRTMTAGTHVHLLENEVFTLNNVRVLGCTLWTDFALNRGDNRELAMYEAARVMTDYKKIRLSPNYQRLKPVETYRFHRTSMLWLERELTKPFEGRTVVISHHAPSLKSLRGEPASIDAAYCSNLENFMSQHSIDLWIHGHTHHCVDYTIGNTRVVSNPRGYPGETESRFDPGLVITV